MLLIRVVFLLGSLFQLNMKLVCDIVTRLLCVSKLQMACLLMIPFSALGAASVIMDQKFFILRLENFVKIAIFRSKCWSFLTLFVVLHICAAQMALHS